MKKNVIKYKMIKITINKVGKKKSFEEQTCFCKEKVL